MKHFPEDDGEAVPVVPIFSLHEGAHPFCTNPGCHCLQDEKAVRHLLQEVIEGKLRMLEVIHNTIQWRREVNGN